MYHVPVHSLAERVLSHIRRQDLLRAGDRVGVAVSGGIDSVALLRLLLELRGELGIVLSVIHFNHQLRGAESDADQEFAAGLAREHDLEFHNDSDDVAQHAAEEQVSVETAARELRYGFFRYLLGAEGEGDPSGAEVPVHNGSGDPIVESAAPSQSEPQGLKPFFHGAINGTAEAVPFPGSAGISGPPELRPGSVSSVGGAAGSRALSKPNFPRASSTSLDKIVTGHTVDDQAETVLMRMIRGAGLRGLGGIHPRIAVEDDDGEVCGEIVRPLLTIRRRELEQYLKDIKQSWREDSTNADATLTRNRVRKLVVPLLEKEFNPAVAENLAELAEIARGEEDYWENEVAGWMGTAVQWSEPEWAREASREKSFVQIALPGKAAGHPSTNPDLRSRIESAPWLVMNGSVNRLWFLGEQAAVQRRLVKAIGEQAGIPLEFRHVEEIRRFAAEDGPSGKELSLPLGWKMIREHDELLFSTPDLRAPVPPRDYEYELPVPGRVTVNETGSAIEALRIPVSAEAEYNRERLLDAESLHRSLIVRNWRPGDRFRPAHTKTPRKIKELLQEYHIAQPERRLWPVVVSKDEIVWVRGFPPPAKFRAKPGREAILIAEMPLSEWPES